MLAAGLSTRYGRLKQLDALGPRGEAIMDFNVYDAANSGFRSVTYVVRREILEDVKQHVKDTIGEKFETNFVCQELDKLPSGFKAPPDRIKPWGTAHAVLCAASQIEGSFAVCNADDLYGIGAFRLLFEEMSRQEPGDKGEATLVGYSLDKTLSTAGGVARGVCVLGPNDILERVTEVQNIRCDDHLITGSTIDGSPVELSGDEIVSMNLWGLTPSIINSLRRQFRHFLEYWGSDTQAEHFLSTSLNAQVELGTTRVRVRRASDTWLGITHEADRLGSQTVLAERLAAGVYPADLADALARLG